MKTVVMASHKGGVGKTTTAINLAVAASERGQRVLLVNLDTQTAIRSWWQRREAEIGPEMLSLDAEGREPSPEALLKVLPKLTASFDLVVIDTPPSVPAWLVDVVAAADLVLIPLRPSPIDIEEIAPTLTVVKRSGKAYAFVMSQTAERWRLTSATARAIAAKGRVAPASMAFRIGYAEAVAAGLGITEWPDAKAAAETRVLLDYVEEVLVDG